MRAAAIVAALAAGRALAGPVSLTIDGAPAVVGDVAFHNSIRVVIGNGILEFEFGAVQNTLPSAYYTLSATRITHVESGAQLGYNVSGSARDGEQHMSFYVDWGGGPGRNALIANIIRVVRVSPTVCEFAIIDNTNSPLQHEHHIIMLPDTPGLYGYNILTASNQISISEVRMNVRFNRCIFNRAYNHERGYDSKQPTYAYLFTQTSLSDETWRVDGVNNPALPCADNDGDLPRGTVYTKYDWSLYHHENPFFGHFGADPASGGRLFGGFFTPLGGVTHTTSAAYYGVGPQHQDLAIHQDALILNYFGANHYGVPGEPLPRGYRRMYGPWLTFVNSVPLGSTPADLLANASAIAAAEIAKTLSPGYLSFIDNQPLYPTTTRSNVTGRVVISDGRPGSGLWVLLTTVSGPNVYNIKEPTWFVQSRAPDGAFVLPAIPPGTYSLYIFGASGSITDQHRVDGVVVRDAVTDLGTINWTPNDATYTHLWQIGQADRMGGEFRLGNLSRSYEHPTLVPGTLTFTIGTSREGDNWYYAQTAPGVWTVEFNLPQVYAGTAVLTISASLTQGNSPRVAVNGDANGITGNVPSGSASTLSRQCVRSGQPSLGTLTFPASRLLAGRNTITFTRGGNAGASGMGYDTVLLHVRAGAEDYHPEFNPDAPAAPAQPQLARLTSALSVVLPPGAASPAASGVHATLAVANVGTAGVHAMDARLASVSWRSADGSLHAATVLAGPDPSRCPAPLGNLLASGSSADVLATGAGTDAVKVSMVVAPPPAGVAATALVAEVWADGGRTRVTAEGAW